MQKQITWWMTLCLLFVAMAMPAQAQKKEFSVTITVLDAANGEPMPGAICTIDEIGIFGMTNVHGVAVLPKIPEGKWKIKTTLLGFKTDIKTVRANKNLKMVIRLKEESLSLDEVVVTAKRKTAGGTTSVVGRQALDHIQATTLSDVMQLVPGGLLQGDKDLTSPEKITIRSVGSDTNNSYGVSVIMDGMPVNNDAAMTNNAYSNAGSGVDMRSIPTDNIESVEVVTGVASAEYGEMTSGAVIVHTKVGTTPLQARVKVTPKAFQASVGKGFALPANLGILNTSFDYANSSGDPRKRDQAFDRISANLGWSKKVGNWSPTVKLAYSGIVDQSKIDPDEAERGTKTKNSNHNIRLSHNGRFAINKWYSRSLKYSVGANYAYTDYYKKAIVSSGSTGRAIFNAREDGIYLGDILPSSYWAEGGSKGRSLNLYGKISNETFVKSNMLSQRFKMGVEYRYSKNYGDGKYNENDALPLIISDSRPRRYIDIPGLTTVSAYFEDNIKIDWKPMPINFSAGVRAQVSQPGKDESVSSISPRLNLSMKPAKWLNLRLAYGMNAKTPGLTYLYPDTKYTDMIVAQSNDGTNQYTYYQTYTSVPDNTKLKNSITHRVEGGADFRFLKGHSITLTGYLDKNTNGFAADSEYTTFNYNLYSTSNGGIQPQPNGPPVIDWNNPYAQAVVMTTTGRIGNTAASENKGLEFNYDMPKIKALSTSFHIRGAWARSETWRSGLSYSNPEGYVGNVKTPPMKFVYKGGDQRSINERFSSQIQAVCHVPKLAMVASLTGQMIWYTHTKTTDSYNEPIGYLTPDLEYHEITDAMLADEDYEIGGFSLQKQIEDPSDRRGSWSKPLWVMNARLTKNISKFLKCSFYASNVNFYQPWQSGNKSSTESEKNTNNFSFGVEVSVKL